jgi:exodeoxyribonuclease V gamma subunit
MREIEILYDNLLDIFSRYKDLRPEEILILAPDIENYSRFIHAIFSNGIIPYAISDRSFFKQNREVDIFIKIIDFSSSRFESDLVLEILEYEEIRKKFCITVEDIEKIKTWISETNTAWGLDIEHKKNLGLPEYIENTWEMFKKRILLGYALPRSNGNFFNGILPYDKAEGKDSFAIGNFLDYLDFLKKYYRLLSEKNTLTKWAEILENLIADFMAEDESMDFINILKEHLNTLKDIQNISEFNTPVELTIVKDFLSGKLKNQRISANYLNGSVTFCEMLPMRSIPFKIICIIGMNDDSYPRNIKPVSFDLIKEKPIPGDRNIRDEDRYLFLETLISAEKELHISYIGQNINDNSVLPPSVMVSELLDYIDSFIKIEGGSEISALIHIRHRLHGFSKVYFDGNKEFASFSQENFSVSENLKAKKDTRPPFYETFKTPKSFSASITNHTLINFFKDPAKFFSKKILGINLDMEESGIVTDENFYLDNLDIYKIGSRAYSAYLDKKESALFMELKAEGSIPHGNLGEVLVNKTVYEFIDAINEIGIESNSIKINSSIMIDGIEISFQIDNIFKEGILSIKNSTINAQFIITAWINHLLLNTIKKNKSLIAAKEEKKLYLWSLKEIDPDEALSHIKNLIILFKKGSETPLFFMPNISFNSSLETTSKKIKLKDDADLRYFNLIFGELDSVKSGIKENIAFQNNSHSVCLPIIENLEEEKGLQ